MRSVNILVTGSTGQVGSELQVLSSEFLPPNYRCFFMDKKDLDITDYKRVEEFIRANEIKVIVNCAAYTAVDKAESDELNADLVNHLAVKNLALLSKEYKLRLIHIPTDYVFDGTNYKPYTENDAPNPQNIYAKTKLLGENEIININPSGSIIIRTSWVYSSFGANFVKTILRLSKERGHLNVVYDQIGTPTYAKDLAQAIFEIIKNPNSNDNTEIYHYSNEGVASWYDFAKEIVKIAKLPCQINPIESKEYPTPAKRPHYSLLNKSKIKKEFNLTIPYWKDSLNECLKKLGEKNSAR